MRPDVPMTWEIAQRLLPRLEGLPVVFKADGNGAELTIRPYRLRQAEIVSLLSVVSSEGCELVYLSGESNYVGQQAEPGRFVVWRKGYEEPTVVYA